MFNKWKRWIAALCAVVLLVGLSVSYTPKIQSHAAASTEELTLDLERDVRYFGRTFAENGARHFSWSNSGFQFSFYGTGATATLKATQHTAGSATETAYVKIYIDGVYSKDIAVPETTTEITLASGEGKFIQLLK